MFPKKWFIWCGCAVCMGLLAESFHSIHVEGLATAVVMDRASNALAVPEDHDHRTAKGGPPVESWTIFTSTASAVGTLHQVHDEGPSNGGRCDS